MGGRDESGKIFVGGLSWNTDQDSLQSYFSQYGEITDCIVMKNPQTGKSRGFGFVSFKDSATVDVILSSKSHSIDGRTVDAKACNARGTTPKPPSRGGFGGGGGGGGGGGVIGRTTKIFVGGLPNNATEDTIREAFQRFGNVTEVVIMFDHEKGRSRGFGFLTFDNEDSVEQACGEHYVDVNGKQVECKKAEPRGAGGRGGGGAGRGGGRGGGAGGGFGGGPQGWGGGGPQQGNWNQGGGWNQDYNQQSWGGQQGWNQGGYSNGWQGMGGMPPGPQGYGMDMGAAPLPVAAPSMSGSEPPARPNMASGDGGSTKSDGRPAAQPTLSAGQGGGQQGYGGYGNYQQGESGYAGQQGQADPSQAGGNYGGYGGGYGDSQQSGYGAQQGGYGAQQGGYGSQQSGYGGAANGGGAASPPAIGGGYQQRQAPGNTGGGGAGRGGSSQNFHPYSR